MSSRFERTGGDRVYDGRMVSVHMDTFRHEDGEEVTREIVRHPGAVGIVAHDGTHLYLVRQPREPIGSPDLLELPAGKLDEEGESPLETAKRELAEEIGKAAEDWQELRVFWPSAGYSDERIWIYLATGLSDVEKPAVDEDERIELVTWPLDDIQGAIDASADGKTIVGLYELLRRRD